MLRFCQLFIDKKAGLIKTGDSYGPSPVSGGAPSPPPMIEGPRRPPSAPVGRKIDPYGESQWTTFLRHFTTAFLQPSATPNLAPLACVTLILFSFFSQP